MTDRLTDEAKDANAAARAEERRLEALEGLLPWQRTLVESSAWKHFTQDIHAEPLTVHFYDDRVEVPDAPARTAKSLYSIALAVLPSQGYAVGIQTVGARAGVTIRIEGTGRR